LHRKEKIIITIIAVILVVALLYSLQRRETELPSLGGPVISVVLPDGNIEEVCIEDFLVRAVAAEMPASFDGEALKAQAVAARTYITAHTPPYGKERHEGASVCCDSAHCQAYATLEQLAANWREDYWKNLHKIRTAVASTKGQVLYYDEAIAESPYFSCCGGSTEAAADCWGNQCEYLPAVFCPYCADSPKLINTKLFTVAEVAEALGVSSYDIYDMYAADHSEGGRVKRLVIGCTEMSGTKLRSLLSLPSAAFTWLVVGENILFTNLGFGHGVGMCQYGAAGMAEQGFEHQQILEYYYPGTEIRELW